MNNGMNFIGTKEKDTKSTNGQNPAPATQAPGKSFLIFFTQFPRLNWPDCIKEVAKKMHVKEGPKIICPKAAF